MTMVAPVDRVTVAPAVRGRFVDVIARERQNERIDPLRAFERYHPAVAVFPESDRA